jgi:hypothetical protein
MIEYVEPVEEPSSPDTPIRLAELAFSDTSDSASDDDEVCSHVADIAYGVRDITLVLIQVVIIRAPESKTTTTVTQQRAENNFVDNTITYMPPFTQVVSIPAVKPTVPSKVKTRLCTFC